jgi:hypothetical protein
MPTSRVATFMKLVCALFFVISCCASFHARAVKLYAYNLTGNRLLTFDSATPGAINSDVAITGLNAGEVLIGLYFNGALAGITSNLSSSARFVRIEPSTGAIVGTSNLSAVPSGSVFGLSLNPIANQLRIVSDNDINIRLPSTTDTSLSYASGDVNFGVNPSVVHIAHTGAIGGTTLYGIDTSTNALVRIGGLRGVPSANGGQLKTIGSLGINPTSFGGMEIDPITGIAYAALNVGGVSNLYTIDLSTGAATLIGTIGSGTTIDALAVVPAPHPCLDLDGDGVVSALTDGLMLTRALLGMTGVSVTNGALPTPTPPRSDWLVIRQYLSVNCGMTFAP